MPNFYDFNKLIDIKTVEVNPVDWISPLFVEYGIDDSNLPMCRWRVKGTRHTFAIPVTRLDFISSGNYKKHFTIVLENFKDEYLEWKEQNFQINWQQEYRQEYWKFIIV
jgi:hypothetical protein